MTLQLFLVVDEDDHRLFITAEDNPQAAAIFMCMRVTADWELTSFAVERVDENMPDELQLGLQDMLTHGVAGPAIFDPALGWAAIPPA